MVKKNVMITLDDDLHRKAKERFYNLSGWIENALREGLTKTKVSIPEPIKCEFCGREGEKETANDIRESGHFSKPNKLTWLWPDETWICNGCLRGKSKNITK